MKRILSIGLVAALALTGCTTTTEGTIKASLPQTCKWIETAHTAFLVATTAGQISQKTIVREQAAYDAAQVACASPENITAADALIMAAQAYVIITTALRSAKQTE